MLTWTWTWSEAYYLSEWAIRLVMLFYVPNKRSPAAARTWLLLIFLLPWPGWILYAIIGRIHLPRKRMAQRTKALAQIRATAFGQRSLDAPPLPLHACAARAATLAANLADLKPVPGNAVQLMDDYDAALDALVADIAAARRHVHLLYYIFSDDHVGQRVADGLIAAAARGVTVRVLMDDVGSKRALRHLAPRLRAGGVEVTRTLPVGLFRRNTARVDLRNHRKIAVIDGSVGHTGSQNIADPHFIKDCPNEELVVRVTGSVVAQLQAAFVVDRALETGDILDSPDLFPDLAAAGPPAAGPSPAQLLPSGPGYGRENAQELMVDLIHSAQQRVVITTPYFVPDASFLQAMRTAVLRGAAVHLVVPARSNQFVTNLAQQSYYDELLEAGVNVHLYRPRFLHAKHLSVDDQVALVGSSNIDIRSFALNAEVSLLIYDPAVVAELAKIQERYFANSDLLTKETWNKRSKIAKTSQNIARLADSLL
jgi:cardiolipin synthase